MEQWAHLEKLFSDLYRKEMDNEENIWRSLPFFSATLAIEVAIVIQLAPLLPKQPGMLAWLTIALALVIAIIIIAVLLLLHRAIRLARFAYIATEKDLIDHVGVLEKHLIGDDGSPADAGSVKAALQHVLIDQFAAATMNNRQINQRRSQARTRAGVLLLGSIVATLMLAAAIVAPRLLVQFTGRESFGAIRPEGPGTHSTFSSPPGGNPGNEAEPAATSPNARGSKGLDLRGEFGNDRAGQAAKP